MSKLKDLTGQSFERLTIIQLSKKKHRGRAVWTCICSCGVVKDIPSSQLCQGLAKSCGCLRKDNGRLINKIHGLSCSTTYWSWQAMKNRCHGTGFSNRASWSYYRNKGVSVCDRWRNSFENFLADMGEKPAGTSLGRFMDLGNYEPDNCKWMTRKEQRAEQVKKIQSQKTRVPAQSATLW